MSQARVNGRLLILTENKKTTTPVFQVLLLNNDESKDVKVHEAKRVDFLTVKAHLQNGGSVFITSKSMQKQVRTKPRNTQQNYIRTRRNMGFLLRQRVRNA